MTRRLKSLSSHSRDSFALVNEPNLSGFLWANECRSDGLTVEIHQAHDRDRGE